MNEIPIFDSLTHPTLNGDWILPRYPQQCRIEELISEMKNNNIINAFAVGMKGIGAYDPKLFIKHIQPYREKLYPIAFADFDEKLIGVNPKEYVFLMKKMGYIGFKIHPRISNIPITHPLLPKFINECATQKMIVLLCTYFYDNSEIACQNNTQNLIKLLFQTQNSKIILVHGGGVKLLEYMEISRAFTNTLLDLSLTISKYNGSSLDMDVKFLFEQFDRRICLGTDFPEHNHNKLRFLFEKFSENISFEKKVNIGYKNILNFLY